ncbi:unnamed protein product [Ilex paraguariensis]|uniref:Uncharacterized protein n=1 Tax=Ilex paraguariensis TaxID=185542 RepID=A0ABC8QUI8_9AQUA
MVLEWPFSSSGSAGWSMIEQAKEELQMLEANHPHRFDYLKLELRSFIFLLESQNLQLPKNSTMMSCSAATTQASTSKKRKKSGSEMQRRMESNVEACRRKLPRVGHGGGYMKRNDSVDAAIERAQACLHKIQQFKNQFLVI